MRTVTVTRLSSDPEPRTPETSAPETRKRTGATAVSRQLRQLRRAVRARNALDAQATAARLHAIAVQPNMRPGRWRQAQAGCERVLSCFPARHARGYLPRLRCVIERLHADAALAAREAGDLPQAKVHLTALIGCLRDRGASAAEQVLAQIDLGFVYLAAGEARAGGRILAGLRPLVLEPGSRLSPNGPQ
jgi:hypothetical protein